MTAFQTFAALTLLTAALAPVVPSNAQLHVWTDSAGNVHATDDTSKIPKGAEVEQRESTSKKYDTHAERVAAFGRPPVRQILGSGYYDVERYLRALTKDPDSLKIESCTEVAFTSSGWLVGCDWRARNGFGGYVRSSNWFTFRHERVAEMHSFDAYSVK